MVLEVKRPLVLVSGATTTVARFSHRIGRLIVPAQRNSIEALMADGRPWAADNGAFAGFDEARFLRMLERIEPYAGRGCLFVTCPDVVADAAATFELFQAWAPKLRARGFPIAFVAQDGIVPALLPAWSEFEALFVGGSTEFKLGPVADALAEEAGRRGKWRHYGRVNTRRRLRHVSGLADSVDGTTFSRWPDRYIPRALEWLDAIEATPRFAEVEGR